MRKKLRYAALTVALSLGGAVAPAHAGIPTVDAAGIAASIAHAVQQAAEAAAQLAAFQQEIEQAQAQFEETKQLISGNSGYGGQYWSEELVSYIPTDATTGSWEEIYSQMDSSVLNSYREKYGLISDQPTQQEVFDKQLTNLRTLEAAHKANNLRLENIQNLQALADAAETPQEKDDIRARLAAEQAAIANEANRLSTVKDLMARQDNMLAQRQNAEFQDFMSNGVAAE